jgi:hypothetical protein
MEQVNLISLLFLDKESMLKFELGSGAMIYILGFIKIDSCIQIE